MVVHAFEVHPEPMEPELFHAPPVGDAWSHEIKRDSYGTQVIKDEDGIRFYTKNGFDWTSRYRYFAEEAAAIDAESFILEGEASWPFRLPRNASQHRPAPAITEHLPRHVRPPVSEWPLSAPDASGRPPRDPSANDSDRRAHPVPRSHARHR